jgi:hypothetical protein
MTWTYNNEVFEKPLPDHYGFVYIITNIASGKKYIGKKLFWHKKTRYLKTGKKRILAESDWKTYFGSSKSLQQDVDQLGADSFTRQILHLCKNKGECSYLEAKEQFDRSVLYNPDLYYNDWIVCRIHRKHV